MISTVVLILNWFETDIVKDSVKRILKDGFPVVVVDNGSDDLDKLKFDSDQFTLLAQRENLGSSKARNIGIEYIRKMYDPDYIFLLDGDILYVRGTIEEYMRVMPEEAGCIGGHDGRNVYKYNHNGTPIREQADLRYKITSKPEKGIPMAWTQYGLFRAEVFEDCTFDEGYGIGMGYEDDDFYHQMIKNGWESYYVPEPLYFHDAHGGKRQFEKQQQDTREEKRKKLFNSKWS